MSDPRYPALYQINTRVWLTELSRALGRHGTLDDVPVHSSSAGCRLTVNKRRTVPPPQNGYNRLNTLWELVTGGVPTGAGRDPTVLLGSAPFSMW